MHADDVIRLLDLRPLSGEGGFFRQTWFSGDVARPDATAIYYLVTPESYSSLHRLADAELFHFYAGDSCRMVWIDEDGDVATHMLGNDLASGAIPQVLVPARVWQGTKLIDGGGWALLGTTMAPGFRPETFELAQADVLEGLDAETRRVLEPYMPPTHW